MFCIKWVVHHPEAQPIDVENSDQDLNTIVESCRSRFFDMICKHPSAPPDGFLIFDREGNEVRRWFESVRPVALAGQPITRGSGHQAHASYRMNA